MSKTVPFFHGTGKENKEILLRTFIFFPLFLFVAVEKSSVLVGLIRDCGRALS